MSDRLRAAFMDGRLYYIIPDYDVLHWDLNDPNGNYVETTHHIKNQPQLQEIAEILPGPGDLKKGDAVEVEDDHDKAKVFLALFDILYSEDEDEKEDEPQPQAAANGFVV